MKSSVLSSTLGVPPLQQPPTNSGLDKALDWGVFITLLLGLVLLFFNQNKQSSAADQRVNEMLIKNLITGNQENAILLAEIKEALSRREAEDESVLFRLRGANDSLVETRRILDASFTELRAMEGQIAAIHRRLDRNNVPQGNKE